MRAIDRGYTREIRVYFMYTYEVRRDPSVNLVDMLWQLLCSNLATGI